MSFTHNRQEILSGIGFNTIIDRKFKSNVISIKMFTKLKESEVSLNSLVISTIGSVNAKYRTISSFSQRLSELYGSSVSSDVSKIGDIQVLSLNANCIDDKYTFNNENLLDDVIDILIDCIFNPFIENNGFDIETFNITKKELLDNIDSEINNKRTYAIIQSKKTIFKNEPASILSYGTKPNTLKATPQEAYQRLQQLLNTCNIEIFYVGSTEKVSVLKKFKEAFSQLNQRVVEDFPKTEASIIKQSVEEVYENIDVTQSKMVMALKTTHQNKYDNIVMNTILGMSPFSKLFTNVREKLSLCYYCQSSYDNQKKTIFIDSGVELENVEKSKEAILQQVKDIQNGSFTNEDIENAVKYLCNSLKSIGDTQSSYINWYFSNVLVGENRTIESEYEKYQSITKDDIIASAKALKLDTIYVLKPIGKEVE